VRGGTVGDINGLDFHVKEYGEGRQAL